MFPRLPPFAPSTSAVEAALRDIGKPGGIRRAGRFRTVDFLASAGVDPASRGQ